MTVLPHEISLALRYADEYRWYYCLNAEDRQLTVLLNTFFQTSVCAGWYGIIVTVIGDCSYVQVMSSYTQQEESVLPGKTADDSFQSQILQNLMATWG